MNLKYITVFILLTLSLFLSNCERRHTVDDPNDSSLDKPWYHENDFLNNDLLHAKLDTPVVLDLGVEKGSLHYIRYAYEESGEYLFCIDPKEKFITGMTLFDKNKNTILSLEKDEGCKNLYIDAEKYSMEIIHDTSKIPENGTVTFISHPPLTTNENNSNISDDLNPPYFALQVTGGIYDKYFLSWVMEYADSQKEQFLAVTQSLKPEDSTHLFYLNKDGVLKGYNLNTHIVSYCMYDDPSFYCGGVHSQDWEGGYFIYSANEAGQALSSIDLLLMPEANATYALQTPSYQYNEYTSQPESLLYAAENQIFYSTKTTVKKTNATFLTLANMKYYKSGSQYVVKENEVAFSTECDMDGPTYVLNGDIPDAVILTMNGLKQDIKSVQFGSDQTNLIFFAQKDYKDWQYTVDKNSSCLETPLNVTMGSIKVLNAKKVFISSHQCNYCNLMEADFSNRTLDNVSLISANLTKVQFNESVMQKAKMCNAVLHGANLNYANLNGSAMYGAFLNGDSANRINGASLNGAYMKNVNLAGAHLSGASFKNANFYSDTVGLCDPTDCSYTTCASATSTTLNSTNFNNAYLTGLDFSNADIYSSDFTNAVLAGAKFTNAAITYDSSTSERTSFNGAYLQGVDFSLATVDHTDFTNAYVDLNHTSGRLMYFKLTSEHASFKGWEPLGEPICTMYAYSAPTDIPILGSSSFCPDGSSADCNSTVWNNPKVPMDQAIQAASYATDTDPVCDSSEINFNW